MWLPTHHLWGSAWMGELRYGVDRLQEFPRLNLRDALCDHGYAALAH